MKLFGFLILFFLTGYGFLWPEAVDSEQDSRDGMRIMSYNIRFDNPDDGINAWPNRSGYVADLIENVYQPDLIGVQEALVHQLQELDDLMEDYSWVGVGRDDGNRAGEYSPIFYNSDKLELVQTNTFWLSEYPDIPGSQSWDAALPRIVTWAKFKELENDKEFLLFNTHFDHLGVEARRESAKLLLESASRISGSLPFIITGDMNVTEDSDVYELFSDHPLIWDALYASQTEHSGPTASFNNWVELRGPGTRIDYIFVQKDVEVLRHKIVDDRYENRFPSDHLPVVADILLPDSSLQNIPETLD